MRSCDEARSILHPETMDGPSPRAKPEEKELLLVVNPCLTIHCFWQRSCGQDAFRVPLPPPSRFLNFYIRPPAGPGGSLETWFPRFNRPPTSNT